MENWRAIPGFEGIYEASDLGRIRSAEGKTTYSDKWGVVVHWKQRIIKQHYMIHKRKNDVRRDARITLWKDKKPHYFLVARLIALTWCEGYAEGMTVNHIDGNPENNRADNLEWTTLADNIRHGFSTGLYDNNMKPVTIQIEGKYEYFPSMAAASRAIKDLERKAF